MATWGHAEGLNLLPVLVKNIHTEAALLPDQNLAMERIGDQAVLVLNEPGYGEELWISDDTPAGLHLLKDINPGKSPASPRLLTPTQDGRRVFFSASEQGRGSSLWVTDGTEAGTLNLTLPTSRGGQEIDPTKIQAFRHGVLCWSSYEGGQKAVWFSDGTPAGTVPVLITPDLTTFDYLMPPVILGDQALIWSSENQILDLWRTDGTAEGTVKLASYGTYPYKVVGSWGGRHYFMASDSSKGLELRVTDGTVAGTRLVKDINSGKKDTETSILAQVENGVFFMALVPSAGWEPWFTDGTAEGTVRLGNFGPGSKDAQLTVLGAINNRLCFLSETTQGITFWTSDGTVEGTQSLGKNSPREAQFFGKSNRHLYFRAWNEDYELWVTDGTLANTIPVKNLFENESFWMPSLFNAWDDGISFWSPSKRWFSDIGAPADLRGIPGSLLTGFSSSTPASIRPFGNRLLVAHGPMNFGTVNSLDVLCYDPVSSQTQDLFSKTANKIEWTWTRPGKAIFSAIYGTQPTPSKIELWATDGTTAGSGQLATLLPGLTKCIRQGEERMFFLAQDPAQRDRITLWKTDGSVAGTKAAQLPLLPDQGSMPSSLTRCGGFVFFTADNGTQGRELWRTDGTEAGTLRLTDIAPGRASSEALILGAYDGLLYFQATSPTSGKELWRSDGSEAGTFMLREINPSVLNGISNPKLVPMNGYVYFTATNATTGTELWRTNGTTAGTQMVVDLAPGINSSSIAHLTVFKGRLYFYAQTVERNHDIWSTDGTAEGTLPFSNNAEGIRQFDSGPLNDLRVMDDHLYWVINFGSLKRTDGTPGTFQSISGPGQLNPNQIRPPTPGASLSPGTSVLYTYQSTGLWSLRSTDTAAVKISNLSGINQIWIAQGYVIFTRVLKNPTTGVEETFLWSSNGQIESPRRSVPQPIDRVIACSDEKVYYTLINERGLTDIECVFLNGSGRTRLLSDHPTTGVNIATSTTPGAQVFFTLYRGSGRPFEIWESLGNPENTRQIGESQNSSSSVIPWGNGVLLSAPHPLAGEELHSLDSRYHPSLGLIQDDGSPLGVSDDSLIEFPAQIVNQLRVRTLRVRNNSMAPELEVAFSAPGLSDFQIQPRTVYLGPAEEADVEITFTPTQAGTRETSVTVTAYRSGSSLYSHSLRLRGRGVNAGDVSEFITQPSSQLVRLWDNITFHTEVLTPAYVLSTRWTRTPGQDPPTTGPTLTLTRVNEGNVGTYDYSVTTTAGEIRSRPAHLGIINGTTGTPVWVAYQRPTQLTCIANAPSGSSLTYQWLYNGRPLTSGGRIQGSQTATLTIANTHALDEGNYECMVTMHAPDRSITLSQGITPLRVLYPPSVVVTQTPRFLVGAAVQTSFPTDYAADRFTATGLPPGLTMDAFGLISGSPTRARERDPSTGLPYPYYVTVTASNEAGSGPPVTVPMLVLPMAPAGTYEGILDRNAELFYDDKKLGGRARVTVTNSGSITGEIVLEGKTYRFKADAKDSSSDSSELYVRYLFNLRLGSGKPTLQVDLSGNGVDSLGMVLINDNVGNAGTVLRPSLTLSGDANLLRSVTGRYLINLRRSDYITDNPPIGPQVPGGAGYLFLNIGKTGRASWSGRLADGTAITGNADAVFDDFAAIPLHVPLYRNTGSVQGWLTVQRLDADAVVVTGKHFTWMKMAQEKSTRVYDEGILLHELHASGANQVTPHQNSNFWEHWLYRDHIHMKFTGEGLPEEGLHAHPAFDEHRRITLPPLSEEGNFVRSFTLDAEKGTFKGSLRFPIPSTPNKTFDVPFQGIFDHSSGQGYFLLPQLTEEPSRTPKTAPLKSGRIELNP